MRKLLILFFFILSFVSCTYNTFEQVLFRTLQDPFCDSPITNSDTLENTIFLNWQEDEACDKYYLMKSYDQPGLNFTCVYEGSNTNYTDTNVESNSRYVYRLDKKRGNKLFKGKNYSYAYGANCRKDAYENNNTESNATFLEYDLTCNLSCVKYETEGVLHLDEDWFFVTVPPMRSAEIIISQKGLENTGVNAETQLNIQVIGEIEKPVAQKSGIILSNSSTNPTNIFFRVFPKTTGLFTASSCVTVIEYTISLNKIFNYGN